MLESSLQTYKTIDATWYQKIMHICIRTDLKEQFLYILCKSVLKQNESYFSSACSETRRCAQPWRLPVSTAGWRRCHQRKQPSSSRCITLYSYFLCWFFTARSFQRLSTFVAVPSRTDLMRGWRVAIFISQQSADDYKPNLATTNALVARYSLIIDRNLNFGHSSFVRWPYLV